MREGPAIAGPFCVFKAGIREEGSVGNGRNKQPAELRSMPTHAQRTMKLSAAHGRDDVLYLFSLGDPGGCCAGVALDVWR
jgi:hypothetical protein